MKLVIKPLKPRAFAVNAILVSKRCGAHKNKSKPTRQELKAAVKKEYFY